MMKQISIPRPKDDQVVSQLLTLYETLRDTKASDKLCFCFGNLDWVTPLLILPLAAYITSTGSHFELEPSPIADYLKTIGFPDGVDSVSSLQQKFQEKKTYVPISILRRGAGIGRERLEELFTKMVFKITAITSGAENAILYPIAELVNNIFEHSGQNTGYVFAQFYPKKSYLDMCIVDCGRGLAQCYKQETGQDYSDMGAIQEAMRGHSTKSLDERGYGLRTSKRVVCEALGGAFILLSGTAALISAKSEGRLVTFPGFQWQGVIIAYRIPKPSYSIDITPYLG